VFISCDFSLSMAINLSCMFQIIFLQEVYSLRDIEKIWSVEWSGKVVFCHGTKHSCGTLVLFHP